MGGIALISQASPQIVRTVAQNTVPEINWTAISGALPDAVVLGSEWINAADAKYAAAVGGSKVFMLLNTTNGSYTLFVSTPKKNKTDFFAQCYSINQKGQKEAGLVRAGQIQKMALTYFMNFRGQLPKTTGVTVSFNFGVFGSADKIGLSKIPGIGKIIKASRGQIGVAYRGEVSWDGRKYIAKISGVDVSDWFNAEIAKPSGSLTTSNSANQNYGNTQQAIYNSFRSYSVGANPYAVADKDRKNHGSATLEFAVTIQKLNDSLVSKHGGGVWGSLTTNQQAGQVLINAFRKYEKLSATEKSELMNALKFIKANGFSNFFTKDNPELAQVLRVVPNDTSFALAGQERSFISAVYSGAYRKDNMDPGAFQSFFNWLIGDELKQAFGTESVADGTLIRGGRSPANTIDLFFKSGYRNIADFQTSRAAGDADASRLYDIALSRSTRAFTDPVKQKGGKPVLLNGANAYAMYEPNVGRYGSIKLQLINSDTGKPQGKYWTVPLNGDGTLNTRLPSPTVTPIPTVRQTQIPVVSPIPTVLGTRIETKDLNSGNASGGARLLRASISAAQSDGSLLAKIGRLGANESLTFSDGGSIQNINSPGKLGPRVRFTVLDASGKKYYFVIEYNRKTGKLDLPKGFPATQASSATNSSVRAGSARNAIRVEVGQLLNKNAKQGSVIAALQDGIGAIHWNRSKLQKLDTEKGYEIKFENGCTVYNSGIVGSLGPIIEFKVEGSDGSVFYFGVELNRRTGKLDLPSGFSKIKVRNPGLEYFPAPSTILPKTNGASYQNLPW
jgi:hypothetical protein